MRYYIVGIFVVSFSFFASGEIFKWVDAEGNTHFGDAEAIKKADKNVTRTNIVLPKQVNTMTKVNVSSRVTMYSTTTCGYCKQAKKYFSTQGIAFVEYMIDKNRVAKKAYEQLGGSGVPLFMLNGQRMQGFSESRFERFYQSASVR